MSYFRKIFIYVYNINNSDFTPIYHALFIQNRKGKFYSQKPLQSFFLKISQPQQTRDTKKIKWKIQTIKCVSLRG